MPEYTSESATTAGLDSVTNVKVSASSPDAEGHAGETRWYYNEADKHLGYYQNIPEINSALKVLVDRVVGQGWESDTRTKVILENIRGSGKQNFIQIIKNLLTQKKIFGDAFAQIIRNDNGTLINLKPLYPGDIVSVWDENGMLVRYEQINRINKNAVKKIQPKDMLHLMNRSLGNEIHGQSLIKPLKKIIDAKNEALTDEIAIRHRDKALGIAYYDTDDTGKITFTNTQIKKAVENGDMLGLPKDTVEITEFPNKSPADRIQWLQYLDNLFYQVVGTPKVLVTSEGFTEAGGKAGLLAFEPNEIAEKKELEDDLWNQLARRVTFARSPSILGNEQETQQKNAGQTGIQQNETQVNTARTE